MQSPFSLAAVLLASIVPLLTVGCSAEGATRKGVAAANRTEASLLTGTWIRRSSGATGHCVLKVQNGTEQDAIVRLATALAPRRTIWIVYIRAHEQAVIAEVAPGSFLLRFSLGRDWDFKGLKFQRNASFFEAGRELDFKEKEPTTEESGSYTELYVTLNQVPRGNLIRKEISEAEFNDGS